MKKSFKNLLKHASKFRGAKQADITSQHSQIPLPHEHPLSALICIYMWRQRYKNVLLGKIGGGGKKKEEKEKIRRKALKKM